MGLGILIYVILYDDMTVGSLAQGFEICEFSKETPQILSTVSWSGPLTYGMILLCLAVFKAAEYWKMESGFKGSHLVGVLIMDQLLYYGLLSISNPLVSNLLGAAGSPTLLCVLGSHLLINLKKAGERGVNEGTNYRSRSVSDIEFAEGAPANANSNDEGMMSA
ncbi:uncharacterized protein FOMMEDRAFT_159313 [Fomitiporia mediterranea MF3/22]|uniref:uncharacterized protein n=1 Tax=Fomitiporia mediterranea (strain MF3/22) TaxID=694068 RepID=UPI0004408347|nr:uncharacterized protein FOMMEDRAFT_159313 [Fomitiporia mediterranea MF3/22]EJD00572.1 hypothetical protein FOMMEDRAFT_159313 [Fomitiporia mediterranea MF3/22]